MDLKENEEGFVGGYGVKNEKEKCYIDIVISKM